MRHCYSRWWTGRHWKYNELHFSRPLKLKPSLAEVMAVKKLYKLLFSVFTSFWNWPIKIRSRSVIRQSSSWRVYESLTDGLKRTYEIMLRVSYMGTTEWLILHSLRHYGFHHWQCQNRGVKSDRILEQKMALCLYILLRVQVSSYAVLSAM
jgi:hypothetical protein